MTAPFRGSASELTQQRLRGKSYVRMSRDLYVLRNRELDLRARAEGALVIFPEAVVCLRTAALLWKLPVDDDDDLVHVDRGPGAARSERPGVRVHRFGIPADQVHDLAGLTVSDGPRTFADLADHLDLEGLVAVGDVVLRRWGSTAIDAAVARHGSRRGAVLLRTAVPLLDAGADSPPETRARLRLHAAGFTGLRHKVVVRDEHGGWLGEPDLADEVARVALQHEGAIHFAKGEKQRRKDLTRDEVVRAQDWEVVSSTALDDAVPERLLAKVTAAYLRAARLRGSHVLPPHLR